MIPALMAIVTGLLGLTGYDPLLYSLSHSIQVGAFLLAPLSAGLVAYWFFRVRANVGKLGAVPLIGITAVVVSTLKALLVAIPIVLATRFVPALRGLAGLAFGGSLILLGSFAPRLMDRASTMLWKSSVSPANPAEELPSYAGLGIYKWYLASIGLILHSRVIGGRPDVWTMSHSATLILAGLAMGAFAYGGGRLVLEVARRQESRLLVLGSIAHHRSERKPAPVSDSAASRSWSDSESLV